MPSQPPDFVDVARKIGQSARAHDCAPTAVVAMGAQCWCC